jgi:ABC-type glycerol-3-phosphate transport system permease component
MSIPRDYDDAARIDGASRSQVFLRIILPLARPALVTVAIFSFLARWNDFLGPLIYLQRKDSFTVSLGLSFYNQTGTTFAGLQPWNLLMAATLVATLPPVLVFFFLQRYFIQGVVVSGLKG